MKKMTLQGNFYPMTSAAYLEDNLFRLTLLSGQSHGVASLNKVTCLNYNAIQNELSNFCLMLRICLIDALVPYFGQKLNLRQMYVRCFVHVCRMLCICLMDA